LWRSKVILMKSFSIPFVGLKLGKHHFQYSINNTFFTEFGYDQFEEARIKIDLILDKRPTLLDLAFEHSGEINVPCDLTGEFFDLPIKGTLNLIVQFGQEYNDENEELLILPHGEYQLNVAQYIYEMIVLSIPAKRIHTGIKNGNVDVSDYQKHITYRQPEDTEQKEIDPRWSVLENLLRDDN